MGKPSIDQVRILGKEWSVVCVPDLTETFQAWGATETWEQRIRYSDGMTPSQTRDTVLHETIHAIEETLGLDMSEQQVHALSAGLFCVTQDNPEFTKWLFNLETKKTK